MNLNPNASLFFLACILCMALTSAAQEVRFSSGIQFGTYAMKDLKEFQSRTAAPDFLNTKQTKRFSPSVGYQGSFVYVSRKRFGGGIEFSHTGAEGKVVGENQDVIYFHHRVTMSAVGGTLFVLLNEKESPWEILISVSTGGTMSKFRRRFPDFEKGPQTERYFSRSIYASGGPTVTRKFKHWFVNATAQYFHDFGGRFKLAKSSDIRLYNASNNEIGPDWSGLRVSVGVGARLSY